MSALVSPGTVIAVVAPAGIYNDERLARGLAVAEAQGHRLEVLPQAPWRYLAGDDAHRLGQLHDALSNPAYGAVWAARGGYGVTRLLPQLDWRSLPKRPLIGFSDLTPLLHHLHVRVGSPTVHGPVVHSLGSTDDPSLAHLFALLAGESHSLPGETWVEGTAEGPVLGGNLTLLAATCGTPWQIDTRGAILLLEDVGEPPYRIDRAMQQLASAGLLDDLAGVAFGQFTGCRLPDGVDWSLRDVLLDHTGSRQIPVLGDLPVGHGAANRAWQVGARARIEQGRLNWVS